jgi:tetratricopeptide (TPR) repeat protein
MRKGLFQLWLSIFVVSLWVSSCKKEKTKSPSLKSESSVSHLIKKDNGYVGDEDCAFCHEELFNSYKQTGMGRSFYLLSEGNQVEDFSTKNLVYDPNSNFYYELIKDENAYYQIEYRKNEKGNRTHELKRRVDFVIGSGNNTRSYLSQINGRMVEMPVTWYAKKAIWDMSPGYDKNNFRFSRPIIQKCMTCHNSFVEFNPYSINQINSQLPLGIGCERCHGPGKEHVDFQFYVGQDPAKAGHGDPRIVNPGKLIKERQLDVCFQCHLQGELSVLKGNNSWTDFRPGNNQREFRSIFVEDNFDPENFRIASQGARMVLSECFTKSDGELTCTTCHDPHVPVQTVTNTFFNNKCSSCHTSESMSLDDINHEANANCISCHMRQSGTSDIPHVNVTDHWIRREIQSYGKLEVLKLMERSEPIRLRSFFEENDELADLRKGIAYVKLYESKDIKKTYLKWAIPLLKDGLLKYPLHEKGRLFYGKALYNLRDFQSAKIQFKLLTDINPNLADAWIYLGLIYQNSKLHAQAETAYRNALAINPESEIVYNNLGNVLAELNRLSEAKKAYLKAIDLNSWYSAPYNNLGDLLFHKYRNTEESLVALNMALKLNPDFIEARNNKGSIYISKNQMDLAENEFKMIKEVNPEYLPAFGNLAFIYNKLGKKELAKAELVKLLAIAPNNIEAKNMLKTLEKN